MRNTDRVSLSPLLKRFKFFFDVMKQTTDMYLFCTDLETNTVMLSPALVQDFDLPGEIVRDFDRYWCPLIHPEEQGLYLASIRQVIGAHIPVEHALEYRVRSRKGDYVWISCRGRVGLDREGNPQIFAGMMQRMARRNQADEVTGLLNKYQFEHGVKLALDHFRSDGTKGAIMIFGLDNFKIVNETCNRTVGDQVLKYVARKVSEILPPMFTLYKLDGDEFGVIYPTATEEKIDALFTSIQKCMSRPISVDGRTVLCTVTAGTVYYPEGGRDYLVLYKHAEAAMDIAKRDGKNRNCVFSKEEYNRWVRSISLRDSLRDSVERGFQDFTLFFQPQVDAVTQNLIGAEALLRWKNPKGRMVSPMEFIPILEETKLILPVGRWVFDEAARVCRRWRNIIPNFKVSVNMSYEQIKDRGFKDFVMDCMQRYNLPCDSMILELTESKIIADWSYVNREFDYFRQQGISIAMDDFGTGYSSLSTLKNISCDIVKIDREFVKRIVESDFDRQLVKYTVALCHSIGITTCVEGVEEEDEYHLISKECAADVIQGYFFGHLESVSNFEDKFLPKDIY